MEEDTEKKKMGMKKRSQRMIQRLFTAFFLTVSVLNSAIQVYAAEAKAVSTVISDGSIYIYVKGISKLEEGSGIQIGTVACPKETIAVSAVSDMDVPIRTILLVDNSQSIPNKKREDIQIIAKGVINGGLEREQFRIGTFSDELTYLSEFTSDKELLNKSLEEITYNNQDTYLSDILYEVISELKEEGAYTYTRILIFSDGADDKAIGYTNDEVRRFIEKNPYQVYTVGIPGKKNDSKLETMFSFSRAASSEYYLLDETISNEDIIQALLQDQENLCIRVQPEPSLMDGSSKNILLKLNTSEGPAELVTSVDMPFGEGAVLETETEPEETTKESMEETEPAPLPVLKPETDQEQREEEKSGISNYVWMIAVIGAAAVVAGVVAIVLKKRKHREKVFDKEQDSSTVIYEEKKGEDENYFVLKNLDRPDVSFRIPIKELIRIGRKDKDINLDDDRMVSHDHCEIIFRQGVLYIKDNNSTNGTWYRGARVYEETPIADGDTVKIGKYSYRVEVVDSKEEHTMMYVENVQTDDAKALW